MTEKQCNNCDNNGRQMFYPSECTGCCPDDTDEYLNWKPKKKEDMTEKRVIFESEEEFDDFYANCGRNSVGDYDYKVMKEKVIAKGYIRRNPVEEYKDMIKEYKNSTWDEHYYILHEKVIKSFDEKLEIANNAIQYLENHIVELNKKVGKI